MFKDRGSYFHHRFSIFALYCKRSEFSHVRKIVSPRLYPFLGVSGLSSEFEWNNRRETAREVSRIQRSPLTMVAVRFPTGLVT